MAWFKVDDRLWAHPKWMGLGAEARALWITAGSYCAQYETDGTVLSHVLPSLVTGKNLKRPSMELVSAGLWVEVEGGYRFHNWDEFQPTKAQLDAERSKARERMRRAREAKSSGEHRKNFARSSDNPDPTRPDPIVTKEDKSSLVGAKAQPTKKRATQIPDTWEPTDDHRKRALELGVQVITEAEKFRNHHGAKGSKFVNWNLAFTNWLINAGEYRQRDNQHTSYGPTAFAGVNPFGGTDDNPF